MVILTVDHIGEQNLQLYNLFVEIAKAIHTLIIVKFPHWFEKMEELFKKAEKYHRKVDSDDNKSCGDEALVAMGVKLMPQFAFIKGVNLRLFHTVNDRMHLHFKETNSIYQ